MVGTYQRKAKEEFEQKLNILKSNNFVPVNIN